MPVHQGSGPAGRSVRGSGIERSYLRMNRFKRKVGQNSCCHLLKQKAVFQVDALVILWARIVDRINMDSVMAGLTHVQLSSMLERLGYNHVLRATGPPFGCRLLFNLAADPDQAAAALYVCRTAAEAQKVCILLHITCTTKSFSEVFNYSQLKIKKQMVLSNKERCLDTMCNVTETGQVYKNNKLADCNQQYVCCI